MLDFSSFGPRFFVSHNLGTDRKQTRFPRSKCKRIRRKWSKMERNWVTTMKRVIMRVGNDYVCDPLTYATLNRLSGASI